MRSLLDFRDAYSAFCNALEGLNNEIDVFAVDRQNQLQHEVTKHDTQQKISVAICLTPFVPKNVYQTLAQVVEHAYTNSRSITMEDIARSNGLVRYQDLEYILSMDTGENSRFSEDELRDEEIQRIVRQQQELLFRYLLLINFATEDDEANDSELNFPILCEKMIHAINMTKQHFPTLKSYNPNDFTPRVLSFYWRNFFTKEEFFWFIEKIYADQLVELCNHHAYFFSEMKEQDRYPLIQNFEEISSEIMKHLDHTYFGLQLV